MIFVENWPISNLLDSLIFEHPWSQCYTVVANQHEYITYLASTLASSPSMASAACGVLAGMTCRSKVDLVGPKYKTSTHKMVITMWAIFVTLVVFCHILPKHFFAFLACKRHLCRLGDPVFLSLGMALRTVEPQLATRSADGDLRI